MSEAIVTAEHLSKSFGARRVLDDISFSVERGDVIGVLGKNGAGKTTLLEIMLGFSPASGGAVRVFGHDSFRLPGAAKARVGFVPQSDELIDQLTARNQLRLISAFYADWDDTMLEKLSNAWELNLDQRVRELSIGQRQKLSILIALGHRPELLMLDEPVASLDPIARRQFLEQVVELSADGSRAVVFSTHIVSDIERLANKIWILKNGHLYWSGDLDALKESIVRVHVRGPNPAPSELFTNGVISKQVDGTYACAVISGWSDTTLHSLRNRTNASVEVERLGLEEIFLELHR